MLTNDTRLKVIATDSLTGEKHLKLMNYAEYLEAQKKNKKNGRFIFTAYQL
jgi:hypothetical protein